MALAVLNISFRRPGRSRSVSFPAATVRMSSKNRLIAQERKIIEASADSKGRDQPPRGGSKARHPKDSKGAHHAPHGNSWMAILDVYFSSWIHQANRNDSKDEHAVVNLRSIINLRILARSSCFTVGITSAANLAHYLGHT